MADQGISMPAGIGGLTRYFEESESKIQLKPMHIVVIIAALILIEIGLWSLAK